MYLLYVSYSNNETWIIYKIKYSNKTRKKNTIAEHNKMIECFFFSLRYGYASQCMEKEILSLFYAEKVFGLGNCNFLFFIWNFNNVKLVPLFKKVTLKNQIMKKNFRLERLKEKCFKVLVIWPSNGIIFTTYFRSTSFKKEKKYSIQIERNKVALRFGSNFKSWVNFTV